MIAFSLLKKIVELFVYLGMGFAITKLGILKPKDSLPLSKVCVYLIIPCSILNSFQVELTSDILQGMGVVFGVAVVAHIVFILLADLFGHFIHADVIERASIIYSNCGNLIIPIVASVLGDEWVIYISAYITVFNILFWTHGKRMFSRGEKLRMKDILTNTNLISIFVGMLMLATGIQFSGIPKAVVGDMAAMIGPVSMMITGVILGGMDIKKLFSYRRSPVIVCLRMLLCPAVVLALMIVFRLEYIIPDGHRILMIPLLCAAAPTASLVNQCAVLYGFDEEYAGVLNMLTTLCCIVTMPVFVWLFDMIGHG